MRTLSTGFAFFPHADRFSPSRQDLERFQEGEAEIVADLRRLAWGGA